jgi:hypothetical protein
MLQPDRYANPRTTRNLLHIGAAAILAALGAVLVLLGSGIVEMIGAILALLALAPLGLLYSSIAATGKFAQPGSHPAPP